MAAAVWDYADGMQMLRTFWNEAVVSDPAIAARDEALMPFCKVGELAALWSRGGLLHVDEQPLTIQMAFASFEDYWTPFLGGQGPAGAYAASLPEAERDVLRLRLRKRLVGDDDRAFTLPARAWAVRGTVSGERS